MRYVGKNPSIIPLYRPLIQAVLQFLHIIVKSAHIHPLRDLIYRPKECNAQINSSAKSQLFQIPPDLPVEPGALLHLSTQLGGQAFHLFIKGFAHFRHLSGADITAGCEYITVLPYLLKRREFAESRDILIFGLVLTAAASSVMTPGEAGCLALALRKGQRTSLGTQKMLTARYSSGSSGSAP